MDSPGGGGGLALGTPWSPASPHAVGADTPETASAAAVRGRSQRRCAVPGGFDSLPTEPSVAARRRAKRRREGPLRGHDCGDVARLQSAVHQSPLQADDHGAIDAVLWRWKVAQKIAMLALSNVAERGIDSRGHALVMGPSHSDYWL
jgi:hypothetical protein